MRLIFCEWSTFVGFHSTKASYSTTLDLIFSP